MSLCIGTSQMIDGMDDVIHMDGCYACSKSLPRLGRCGGINDDFDIDHSFFINDMVDWANICPIMGVIVFAIATDATVAW